MRLTRFLLLLGFLSVFLYKEEDNNNNNNNSSKFNLGHNIWRVLKLIGKNLNIAVLVIIWSYTNTMQFKAVALVGAPTYSVVMQSKIFFTAGFGALLLSRKYSFTKWRALILLVIGCILVSSPILLPKETSQPCDSKDVVVDNSSRDGKRTLRGYVMEEEYSITRYLEAKNVKGSTMIEEVSPIDALFGLAITISISICSGFSNVYFEKILKHSGDGSKCVTKSPTAIWDRNFQLAFYSIIFTSCVSIFQYTTMESDDKSNNDAPFFQGWSHVTFLICVINSLGGFLVAATLKYADAILKCFATAVSIILTTIVGYFFLGNEVNLFSSLGMLTTILSIMNYTLVEVE